MNKQRQAEYQRAWRERNPDYQRKWREAHPDYQRNWHAQHAEGEAEARKLRAAREYLEARGYMVIRPGAGDDGYIRALAALTAAFERAGACDRGQAEAICRDILQVLAGIMSGGADAADMAGGDALSGGTAVGDTVGRAVNDDAGGGAAGGDAGGANGDAVGGAVDSDAESCGAMDGAVSGANGGAGGGHEHI